MVAAADREREYSIGREKPVQSQKDYKTTGGPADDIQALIAVNRFRQETRQNLGFLQQILFIPQHAQVAKKINDPAHAGIAAHGCDFRSLAELMPQSCERSPGQPLVFLLAGNGAQISQEQNHSGKTIIKILSQEPYRRGAPMDQTESRPRHRVHPLPRQLRQSVADFSGVGDEAIVIRK